MRPSDMLAPGLARRYRADAQCAEAAGDMRTATSLREIAALYDGRPDLVPHGLVAPARPAAKPKPARRYLNLFRAPDGTYAEATPRSYDDAVQEVADGWAGLDYAGTVEITAGPGLPATRTIDLSADAQQYGSAA